MVWPSGVAFHHVGADRAAGARPVFHHDGLAELLSDLLHHDTRDDVARAARAERHDRRDGLVRPILRASNMRKCDRERREQKGKSALDKSAPDKAALDKAALDHGVPLRLRRLSVSSAVPATCRGDTGMA